ARHPTPILPGALVAVALLAGLGSGYRLYVWRAGTGNGYLGGLAVIGVTMMTLWLFSIAILLGAELNKVIRDRLSAVRSRPTRSSKAQSR
ncbi:MAG TPA: YhjD/YihY/BrkB family envelope integrity protein, partial [Solirubrobacteraceae bacterium]|nr:YhjD/YihY/BrkB family envelope integrity protein [Solirubrobacteraceae bacterium]